MGTGRRLRGAPSWARYDGFAEWYERWIGGKPPPLIAGQAGVLLPGVAGQRVLDVACGEGRMSRCLAAAGAEVTGIDISAAMLARARAAGPPGITSTPTFPVLPAGGTGGRSAAAPASWH